MTEPGPDIEPYRLLVETVDADGRPVLLPIATGPVVTSEHRRDDDQRPVLRDGWIRIGGLVYERSDGHRTRLLGNGAGEPYSGAGGAPTGWARVQEDAS